MLVMEEADGMNGMDGMDGDLAAFNRIAMLHSRCGMLASERRRLTLLGFALRFDYPHSLSSAAAAVAYARYLLSCAPTDGLFVL